MRASPRSGLAILSAAIPSPLWLSRFPRQTQAEGEKETKRRRNRRTQNSHSRSHSGEESPHSKRAKQSRLRQFRPPLLVLRQKLRPLVGVLVRLAVLAQR